MLFYDVGWMQRRQLRRCRHPRSTQPRLRGVQRSSRVLFRTRFSLQISQSDTSKGEGLALGSPVNAGVLDWISPALEQPRRRPFLHRMSRHRQQVRSLSSRVGILLRWQRIHVRRHPLSHADLAASKEQNDQAAVAQTTVSPSPAVEVMPAKAAPSSILARGRMWLVGGLLLVALLILVW